MSKPRIFLSSTCYDLKALREHLREKIEGMGHELLASEYSSFPISPDLTTIENCKKVVREHADLLVLIVGGKRGSLDATGTRSVVNAEYLEARSRGIDSFVFVDKQVLDLLPIYLKNPAADFSPTVDHAEVFKFVADLKAESRWIYSFTKTEDIIITLQTQLSVFLRMLIERGRVGSLIVPREFASDTRQIIALIQERPQFWEFLLAAALLDQAVASGRRRMKDLNEGVVFRPAESLSDDDAMNRISKLFADIENIATALNPALVLIPPTFGPPGVSGNPIEIRFACQRIASLIDAAVDWETELRFIHVSEKFSPLFESLRGSTVEIIDELANVAPGIREGVKQAQSGPGPHTILVQLTLKSPQTLERFNKELRRLQGGFLGW